MPEWEEIDEEEVAALVDGRLSRRERAGLLARLAVTEAEHDVFVQTALTVREMEDEDQAASGFAGGANTRLVRLGQLLRRLGAAIRFWR